MAVQKVDRPVEYCPVAAGVAAIGDRWTLLIVRELLLGERRFNDIHRGLPGLSRTLLATRLRRMAAVGLVEKLGDAGYGLTEAGRALEPVAWHLGAWARQWFFGEPDPAQLDSGWLLWRLRQIVRHDQLPAGRTVVEFQFPGSGRPTGWLVLRPGDVTACRTDPGFAVDAWVVADLGTLAQILVGRRRLPDPEVRVHGPSGDRLAAWFDWPRPPA